MSEHDLNKLLGGFAADTLTAEEKQQLYSAALQDQELFNTLANEQALKELLADPVVRRRLLQALQKSSSTAPSSPWLDWFRRPAGLAWAGGLAAAFFAIILGTRIYQDSVKEAGRSVATEEATPAAAPAPSVTKPTAPPINEPRLNTQDNATSSVSPKTNALAGKMAKRETTAMVIPEERRVQNSATDSPMQQPEQDGLRKQTGSTSDKRATSNEEAPASADHRPASAPSTSAVTPPAPTKVPTTAAPTSQVASALSARSMFYGESAEFDTALTAEEQEPSQSAQQSGRFEQKKGALVGGKPAKVIGFTKPLGIRYSLKADGGIERPRREKDAGAKNQAGSIDLLIDVNQDGYLQVWGGTEHLQYHLLFPIPEDDQLSSRLIAHQHRTIPVAAGYGTIILRFSRILFDSSIKQAIVLSGRSSLGLLQESVTTNEASGFHERTTYVVNQDLSVQELLVRIPIGKP